jgi:hypothetical protein
LEFLWVLALGAWCFLFSAMNWLLLNSDPCPAAFNLALDEVLLTLFQRAGRLL